MLGGHVLSYRDTILLAWQIVLQKIKALTLHSEEPVQVMSVGAVYDRALFRESTSARSPTAPTARRRGNEQHGAE